MFYGNGIISGGKCDKQWVAVFIFYYYCHLNPYVKWTREKVFLPSHTDEGHVGIEADCLWAFISAVRKKKSK